MHWRYPEIQITHILEDFTHKMDTSTPQNKRFLMISSDELTFFREVQGGEGFIFSGDDCPRYGRVNIHIYTYIYIYRHMDIYRYHEL